MGGGGDDGAAFAEGDAGDLTDAGGGEGGGLGEGIVGVVGERRRHRPFWEAMTKSQSGKRASRPGRMVPRSRETRAAGGTDELGGAEGGGEVAAVDMEEGGAGEQKLRRQAVERQRRDVAGVVGQGAGAVAGVDQNERDAGGEGVQGGRGG